MDGTSVALHQVLSLAGSLHVDLQTVLVGAVQVLVSRALGCTHVSVQVSHTGENLVYEGTVRPNVAFQDLVQDIRIASNCDPCPYLVTVSADGASSQVPEDEAGRALVVQFCSTAEALDVVRVAVGQGSNTDTEALAGLTCCHVRNVLRSMCGNARLPLPDIALVSEEECRQLASWGRIPSTSSVPDMCVHELVRAQVRAAPDRLAIWSVFEGVQLTYRGMYAKARSAAATLCDAGVALGSVVALCVEEGAALVLSELAVMMAGAAFSPINPNDPPLRVRDLWRDLEAVATILSATQPALQALAQELGLRSFDAEQLFAHEATDLDGELAHAATPTPTDLCHVIYTSGSTGKPKGVLMEHRGLVHYIVHKTALHRVAPESRVLMASASTFDPSLGDIFATLACGATLCLDSRAAITQQLGGCLLQTAATHVLTTPALWSLVEHAPDELPQLRVVALGGEALPPPVLRTWGQAPGVELVNTYGVTEVCVYQTHHVLRAGGNSRCIGAPYPSVDAAVLDTCLRPLPPGCVGELCLGGPQVGRGYLKRPDMSREKFIDAPSSLAFLYSAGAPAEPACAAPRWYRTGDLARFLPDGTLELLGRADGQVKLRGQRVELGEIECALKECGVVQDAAAAVHEGVLYAYLALADRCLRELGLAARAAFPAALPGPLLTAVTLHARQVLPPHMVPQRMVLVEAIPVSPNGKVDRKALPGAAALRGLLDQSREARYVPPAGRIERTVARLWTEELHTPVGAQDNFFQLGGDSLSALRVARQIYCLLYHDHPRAEKCPPIAPPYGDIQGPLSPWALARHPVLRQYCAMLRDEGLPFPQPEDDADSAADAADAGATGPGAPPGEGPAPPLESRPADAGESRPEGVVGRPPEIQALFQAVFDQQNSVVALLLDAKAHPDGGISRSQLGTSPLHVAAANSNIEAIELLLRHGARLHATNRTHTMPVHMAAQYSADALRVFLRHGIEPGVRDRNKQTLLHFAARNGNCHAVRVLIESCSDIVPPDTVDRWQRTPVHWAVLNGHLPCLEVLLQLGADPTPPLIIKAARKKTHLIPETPLQVAARARAHQPEFEAMLREYAAHRDRSAS